MTKELEIEFKNMLTKEEYRRLLKDFAVFHNGPVTQHNHYFDTSDFQLKKQRSALRIRNKNDHFECTLKTPAAIGYYEITDQLTKEQAGRMLELKTFEAAEVSDAMQKLDVSVADLKAIGTLTTHRVEFDHLEGLLVIDHSEYNGQEDFEVEFEVTDATAGHERFLAFLQQREIPERPANKKIARFMDSASARSAE
ncbi:cytoplasmic protein [Planococcus antarcticus DSM 14505]|uniref:Adenylate cyclase n=1 Tax=Planococcus antarcticus DSM 14505 TaxID=1185653 RepID=A0A1C7DFX4_9BACL|nr:CYTH domain-containing protein [Planococcus antarcticus]ANU10355.1 adenylate cyclase [Planococcus antarcticus DSM 14505]EIM06873.1 cytoplasmic protein [Planococcus antarcticus DSM 14505]